MEWTRTLARRKFVTRFWAALGLAVPLAARTETAEAQTVSEPVWSPAQHAQDAWIEKIQGSHRFVFDTISTDGFSQSLGFASTFLEVSKTKYGLKDSDSAVIVIARHRATRFGYSDAMWAKYGKQFSEQLNNFVDPKTQQAPTVNIYATAGGSLDRLIQRGVHVAICEMATRGISNSLARALGGEADAYFKELSENLVTNGRLVPAGIVALNRAQEHGFAVYAGG